MNKQVKDILQHIDPISLDELYDYKLLNRIDTKYICSATYLNQIIDRVGNEFKIQASGSERIFGYESLYFDTPEMKTYFDHHMGKRIRYKIRFRKYMDTGDVFLEVKKKKDYIRTNKKRNQCKLTSNLEKSHLDFIHDNIIIPDSGLYPTIWTIFDRITLAGKKHLERITIDTNVRFKNNSHEISMPGLSIIEVKRDKANGISPFTQTLREFNIRPNGFSKYVMGNVLLTPNIKHNRFLKKVVTLNKICNGT
ncbi:MAG: polyphosphate polymerase domain-containing protein [Bacteroidales bacterium]|jgi:hypothetical protein|nr:polyphosphate polymerase domain-containing protein [Bacteroidales bacterium]